MSPLLGHSGRWCGLHHFDISCRFGTYSGNFLAAIGDELLAAGHEGLQALVQVLLGRVGRLMVQIAVLAVASLAHRVVRHEAEGHFLARRLLLELDRPGFNCNRDHYFVCWV